MKPGLCLFTDSLEPSGVGEHMLLLAAELRHQYRIAFACPQNAPGQKLLDHAAALQMPIFALSPCEGKQNGEYRRLQQWLRAHRISIFHGHAGIGWEGHDGIRAARAAGVPVVVRTEHLPYLLTDRVQKQQHHALIPLIDRLICVSQAAGDSFRDAGIAAHKIAVVRNGIRPRRCQSAAEPVRAQLCDELGLPTEARLLLSVGRFTEQKGHCYLLEAMKTVLDEQPQAHCLWAGSGPLETSLRARIDELGLNDNVHLLGRRDDVPALLAAADMLVLPSLFEGLPLVALEAMAVGMPVIGTQVCGTAEAVVDGETGRLVAPRDAAALAGALCEALSDPALAASWGQAGQKYFEREFTATRMAKDTVEVYDAMLRRAQAVHAPPFVLKPNQTLNNSPLSHTKSY